MLKVPCTQDAVEFWLGNVEDGAGSDHSHGQGVALLEGKRLNKKKAARPRRDTVY